MKLINNALLCCERRRCLHYELPGKQESQQRGGSPLGATLQRQAQALVLNIKEKRSNKMLRRVTINTFYPDSNIQDHEVKTWSLKLWGWEGREGERASPWAMAHTCLLTLTLGWMFVPC